MEFDYENIGKLVANENYTKDDTAQYLMVVGYNYLSGRYILFDISRRNDTFKIEAYKSCFHPEKMVTAEEAMAEIDEKIHLLEMKVEKLRANKSLFDDVFHLQSRENYRNELLNISGAYEECCNQLKYFSCYKCYPIDEANVRKGIKRLSKRFHFFFGDDANIVMDAIESGGRIESVIRAMHVAEDKIKKLEKHKQEISKAYSKLKEIRLS